MQKLTIKSLIPCQEYRDALERPKEAEMAGLKSLIEESGQCLMPILYHMDLLGSPIIVDGYTRYDLYQQYPEIFDEPPSIREIYSLSGVDEAEVISWIRRHQAFRRNNEKLILEYQVGKLSLEKGPKVAAEEVGVSHSKVRHAQELAKAIDAVEEMEPGLKEQILGSDIPATKVKEAAKAGDLSGVKESLSAPRSRASSDGSPKSTMGYFKAANSALAKFNRAIHDLENSTTENEWSEEIRNLSNKIGLVLHEWEDAEILGN